MLEEWMIPGQQMIGMPATGFCYYCLSSIVHGPAPLIMVNCFIWIFKIKSE